MVSSIKSREVRASSLARWHLTHSVELAFWNGTSVPNMNAAQAARFRQFRDLPRRNLGHVRGGTGGGGA